MIERHAIDMSTPEGREKWLAQRKPFVGASSGVPAIFGVHRYSTIGALHAEKMGLDIPGPDPNSSVIRRGHALEIVGANEVALQHPEWDIIKANELLVDRTLRLSATPDFYVTNDPRGLGVLQIKTVGSGAFKRHWGGAAELSPPLGIVLQTATEMMLADAAFGAVGVLVIGDYAFDTYITEIPRHKPTEHKIRVAVHAFWEALDAGRVPELDYARDGELIKVMYRATDPGKYIDLRGDNRVIELLETRQQQVELEKAAVKAREGAEAEIRAKIGDAEIALVSGWTVTNKMQVQMRKAQPARELSFRVLLARRDTEQSNAAGSN